eukprot:361619-Chlamydomonas_euryale.AAC.6
MHLRQALHACPAPHLSHPTPQHTPAATLTTGPLAGAPASTQPQAQSPLTRAPATRARRATRPV